MKNQARAYRKSYGEAIVFIKASVKAGWSLDRICHALIEGDYATRSGRGVWQVSSVWREKNDGAPRKA